MNSNKRFRDSMQVKELKLNSQERREIYEKFKEEQVKNFEQYMNYINELLCILKKYRIVSNYTTFSARIKATKSAIKNDENKALDDVFGMEIDFATQGEKAFVSELITGILKETKVKVFVKENGYVAGHHSGYLNIKSDILEALEKLLSGNIEDEKQKYDEYYNGLPKKNQEKIDIDETEEGKLKKYFKLEIEELKKYIKEIKAIIKDDYIENLREDLKEVEKSYKKWLETEENSSIPIVEFQLKTIQVAIDAKLGKANHETYKNNKNIQGGEIDNCLDLPTIYISRLEISDDGKIVEPKELSKIQTLEYLHPHWVRTDLYKKRGKGEK